jgi:SAM-dependent methyltransferase
MTSDVEREQVAYYRARAAEYDEWFFRQGRYDRGARNQQWFDDVEDVRSRLRALGALGDVLELAAGTGLWTERLLAQATSVHAVDASPETLAINHERVGGSERVSYDVADVFAWRPSRRYDTVFFGFWLSHVPDARFADFWDMVASALAPGGRVAFVDSLPDETGTARDQSMSTDGLQLRRLNDGREFRIVKRFYTPREIEAGLGRQGWAVTAGRTSAYFLWGTGTRR